MSASSNRLASGCASPPLLDPSIHEIEVRANGLRFRVLEALPEVLPKGGAEDAPLALALHGFPECAESWRHQLPLLARHGYRAWAPDLRGYGGSDRPGTMEDYALEHLMADVDGLIGAAGARDAMVVAHDWGGIVAWFFAMRRPQRLTRLVVMNVPHPGCAREQLHLRQLLTSWYLLFFQLKRLPEWLVARRGFEHLGSVIRNTSVNPGRYQDELIALYGRNAAEPGALTAMLNYYRSLIRGGGARRQMALGLPRIDVPVLLIWGEQDIALRKRSSLGLAGYASAATVRYLPQASHWVQQDDPETVNRMLEAWLQGEPVPHAPGARDDLG